MEISSTAPQGKARASQLGEGNRRVQKRLWGQKAHTEKKMEKKSRVYNLQCPSRAAPAWLSGAFPSSRAHHLELQFSFICLKKFKTIKAKALQRFRKRNAARSSWRSVLGCLEQSEGADDLAPSHEGVGSERPRHRRGPDRCPLHLPPQRASTAGANAMTSA